MYLRKLDYYSVIQSDNLEVILRKSEEDLGEEANVLAFMDKVAVSEASALISHRYDTDTIFNLVTKWDPAITYDTGQGFTVYYEDNNKTYQPTAISSNQDPVNFPGLWDEVEDPRESKLLITVLDIALYHIHKRINPRNVPEIREESYNAGLEWLQMVGNDKITPKGLLKLPTDEDGGEPGAKIKYGGSTKQNMSY